MNHSCTDNKTGFSQTVLLGMIVSDAQRTPKIPISLRENGPNSLGRPKSFRTVLQITSCLDVAAERSSADMGKAHNDFRFAATVGNNLQRFELRLSSEAVQN